jgi:DNA-binding response OmpR family regulator
MSVSSKPRTILVIDHDATVNDALRMLLSEVGYKAVAAPDLDAAVHLLSTVKVDLVITNYMEPAYRRGDRWPVLEMVKLLLTPDTPLIVITTSPEEVNQSARQLGVADLIGKPFLMEDLLARVARAIDGRRQ